MMLSRNWVKYIQTLLYKKNGKQEKEFIAEGVKLMDELMHSDFTIKKIFAIKEWIDDHQNAENVVAVLDSDLKKISSLATPNKVIAIVEKKPVEKLPDLKNKITLVLDGLQDPGNLGTIIRTADWFGIKNIVASNDTVDAYNQKVIQSTMGSFLRVNIFYVDLIEFFQRNLIPVFGTMLDGESINSLKKINEGLIVIGNESKGIRENIHCFLQHKIAIHRTGDAESLNAAVATGIILWKLTNNL